MTCLNSVWIRTDALFIQSSIVPLNMAWTMSLAVTVDSCKDRRPTKIVYGAFGKGSRKVDTTRNFSSTSASYLTPATHPQRAMLTGDQSSRWLSLHESVTMRATLR